MAKVLNFKGQWRSYQERILNNLNFHLLDKKLHVVAAPGAGKTTLGIEIISRLNKPTLILAPTITIKNQWKQRILSAFLNGEEDIVSTDIRNPKFITVTTYQALLAAFCGVEDNEQENSYEEDDEIERTVCKRFSSSKADKIINILNNSGIKILCFDEAHHLRKEWWKALDYLVDNLVPEQTVAMTATPPYDVDIKEWERYEELCGQIDEIISIPELVKNGDLCPHQDFIHFSRLRVQETEQVKKTYSRMLNFLYSLKDNKSLVNGLENSRYMLAPDENLEAILSEPEFYVSIASFLKHAGRKIPQRFLKIFEAKENELPEFNTKYGKYLLTGILFKHFDDFADISEELELLKAQAKNAGVIQQKSVYLEDSPKIKKMLANSIGKLDSIVDIVKLESNTLKEDLRMVILTDYIKYDVTDCSSLGVIPIWQTLKDTFSNISIGVLTGSVILIPQNIKSDLNNLLKEKDLENGVSITEFERDGRYLKIIPKESCKSHIVSLITQLFNNGKITVLIGTQALLGEGWDAPSINSLILSSTVSSFMLSNQMRGRAIRIDKNNPNKVANIWHLASIKILNPLELIKSVMAQATVGDGEADSNELYDFGKLYGRFEGYEAPSLEKPYVIESGIERVLPASFKSKQENLTEETFLAVNRFMKTKAINRNNTKLLWEKCLAEPYNSHSKNLTTGVETSLKMKSFMYCGGYFYMLTIWATIFGSFAYYLMVLTRNIIPLFWLSLVFVLIMFEPTVKFLKCGTVEGIIRQIGICILETLAAQGLIKTSLKNVKLKSNFNKELQTTYFTAENLSPEENNIVIKALREFLDPIENPRYIFVRKNLLFDIFAQTDYHAIPTVIAQNKKYTDIFKELWKKYIGDCDIVYTRSIEGRQLLLKARKSAFSNLVRPKSKRISKWM